MKRYYDGISDISVFNWDKCTTGELKYTRINIDKGDSTSDSEAWIRIYDTFISRYGIAEPQMYLFDLQTNLAIIQCELADTGDKFLLNKINVLTIEIEDYIKRNKSKSMDMGQVLIIASKWMGYKHPDKSTTVQELYDVLEMIKKEYESNKKMIDAGKKK